MIPAARKLSEYFPITMRGLVLILFLTFLYLEYVQGSSDIIATVMVVALFIIFVTLLLVALVAGFHLRQRTILSLYPLSAAAILSRLPVLLSLKLNPVRIPPLFTLTAEPIFCDEEESLVSAIFSGFARRDRSTTGSISFPHRGHWHTTRIRWTLSDCFGLTAFQWENEPLNKSQSITVQPANIEQVGVPLIASSYREGDAIPHHTEFAGDYYDIKQYHPSDGMNKLLWKLFARSGELLARKPEESVSPEGQIVAFCLANREDDRLAAAFVRYIHLAEEAEMEVIASCLGVMGEAPVRSTDAARDILITAAHKIPRVIHRQDIALELGSFIEQAKEILQLSSLAHVIIFLSDTLVAKPEDSSQLLALGKLVVAAGATPVFCYIANSNPQSTPRNRYVFSKPVERFVELCVLTDKKNDRRLNYLSQFIDACQPYGWQVHEGFTV